MAKTVTLIVTMRALDDTARASIHEVIEALEGVDFEVEHEFGDGGTEEWTVASAEPVG
jgi:hypothetical protein